MNCDKCDARMVCKFTQGFGAHSRYRKYRCPECGGTSETFETLVALLPMSDDETKALLAGITKAKNRWLAYARKEH